MLALSDSSHDLLAGVVGVLLSGRRGSIIAAGWRAGVAGRGGLIQLANCGVQTAGSAGQSRHSGPSNSDIFYQAIADKKRPSWFAPNLCKRVGGSER